MHCRSPALPINLSPTCLCSTAAPRVKVGPRGPRRREVRVCSPATNSGPDRAISCDRTKPKCTNCCRSNRKCQWHNLKLSWPGANDHRRSVVSKSSPSSPTQGRISHARFVHTTYWDMELHHNLTGSIPVRALSLSDLSTCWNPSELETLDSDVLEYCMLRTSAGSLVGGFGRVY